MLLVFHRPLLLGAIHWLAVHQAAKENLHLDFRVEGNVFTALTIRNLHVIPTGPAAVDSADADYLRVEYNLFDLLRRRDDFLEAVELRNARVVIDPAKVRVKVAPRPMEKVTLPAVFPERARLVDVSFVMRDPAHDLVIEHASIELNPRVESTLEASLLQLPSGEAWKGITGRTSYRNRDLILRDVVLNKQTRINSLNVDASRMAARVLTLKLDAILDGAPVLAEATMAEEARSLRVSSHLTTKNLALASAKKLGVLSTFYTDGTIEDLTADFGGLLSSPRTWQSTGEGKLRALRIASFGLDRGTLHFSAHDGLATIAPVELTRGATSITLRGNIDLPERANDLGHAPMHFEIAGDDLDLASLTAETPDPISGAARLHAQLEVRGEKLQSQVEIRGDSIGNRQFSVQHLEGTISARKDLHGEQPNEPWFQRMIGDGKISLRDVRSHDLAVATVDLALVQREASVQVQAIARGTDAAEAVAAASATLRPEIDDLVRQAANVQLTINAPQVAGFAKESAQQRINGALQASAYVNWNGQEANGSAQAYGSDLVIENLRVPVVSAAAAIAQNKIFLNDFTARLNTRDFINAQGTLALDQKKDFAGRVNVDLADASTLQPLLGREIGGALQLNWQGRGSFRKAVDTGSLRLTLNNGRFGTMNKLQAKVEADYSPEGLNAPLIFLASDKMNLNATITAQGDTLAISKIQLDQGTAKYAAGNVEMPFRWRNLGTGDPLFPRDGKVSAFFQSENLDLKKLTEDFWVPAVATGSVSVKMQADGTLENLRAHAEVNARDLRNPKLEKVEPATLELKVDALNGKLTAKGQLKQPKLAPIDLEATIPFDAGKVLSNGSFDENTPLQARVRLPRSSLNFIRQFVSSLQQLDGEAAIDATINGTIANPVFGGSGDIAINAARFENESIPPLRDLKSRLVFSGNTLTLERFGGNLAGGPFTVNGRIVFTKLTEPNLDLSVHADSVLIARNDTLTVRADANLRASGPLATATVTGNVALTDSHFLKDLDLIPIGLPGRPAPPPVEDRPDFALTDPPLRDWKFDVKVTTKDAFSIRGNLATGGAIVDVHVGGTGLHPELKGNVRLQNVEATLPFSRLEVTNGYLYFDPGDSFNPKIDLQGLSVVRDYTVRVYVYGSALAPQAIFTSEPPLPQEEIISLLATGATRQELQGNGNILAGRAAILVVQQLYRKIFKKGAPTQSNTAFDRLNIDLGSVDPRTGRQQATARFKVNNNWVLIGDLGVGGDFRGQVKYLIRFH